MRSMWLTALCGLTLALGVPLLAGCSALGAGGGSGPRVVASFYPLAYVASRVAGDRAEVTNLTSPGVEPHDLELTPQQVADVSDADVVVYEAGFQPSVDEAIDQSAGGTTFDVTDVVPLEDTGASAEKQGDGPGDAAKALLEGDPHLWLDPTLLVPIAEQLADDLAEADPGHAREYQQNAGALVSDLKSLDQDFTHGLATCERRAFVTSHAAFGYLAQRYDLSMVPIAGLSPDVEPSPERLAEIQDYIEQDDITTVFSETLGSKKYADALASDLGVETAVLDPIEGLADDSSDDDYLSLMRANLTALEKANDCT
ncbi:MAG: metal ABC transporter substrate-binding protein [Nocardioidaceae bacterium]